MSYQPGITKPPLIVIGIAGALGNTKRACGSLRWGTIDSKSWPSAPNPCSQITLAVARVLASTSTQGSSSVMAARRLSQPAAPHSAPAPTKISTTLSALKVKNTPP